MNKETQIDIITTGKNFDTVFSDLAAAQRSETEGLPKPEDKRCYLCKRTYGDTSACLSKGKDSLYLLPVNLEEITMNVSEDIKVTYRICPECLVLLSGLAANYRDPLIGDGLFEDSLLEEMFRAGMNVPFEEIAKNMCNVRQGVSPQMVVVGTSKRELEDNESI